MENSENKIEDKKISKAIKAFFIILFLIGYVYLYDSILRIESNDLQFELFNWSLFKVYSMVILLIMPIYLMAKIAIKVLNFRKHLVVILPFFNFFILFIFYGLYDFINPIQGEWRWFFAWKYIFISLIAACLLPIVYLFKLPEKFYNTLFNLNKKIITN